MPLAPLRIKLGSVTQQLLNYRSIFESRLVQRARDHSLNAPPYQTAEVDALLGESTGVRAVCWALMEQVGQMFNSLEIVVDENADLTKVDVEILERGYIALGSELERRGVITK